VQRAGEVIPEIVKPIKERRTGTEKEFSLLEKVFDKNKGRPACPVCGAEIVKSEGEVMYYCSNAACPAQVAGRLQLFVSRGAMDIRGIGERQSVMLLKEDLVRDPADLYYLKDKRAELLKLEKMGEKSVDNMLESIEKSKERSLARVILALGIRHVGGEMAGILAEHFNSLDRLAAANREELVDIPTVGPKIAESIIAFFGEEQNRKNIQKLKDADVKLEDEIKEQEELPLTGQEFVITGKLEPFSREKAEAEVRALGGTTKDNVTRNTSYLVVGADPGGSKLSRAQTLGTKQIDEQELLRLLGRNK